MGTVARKIMVAPSNRMGRTTAQRNFAGTMSYSPSKMSTASRNALNSPCEYIKQRKSAISKLQQELRSCTPMPTPLLRAESTDASVALVPGFDVDLRPDIERANIHAGEYGDEYVLIMGKPYATVSTPERRKRTSSVIRTTPSPAKYPSMCTSPNPLEDGIDQSQHSYFQDKIAGAANRRSARDMMVPSLALERTVPASPVTHSPRRQKVNAHPLDDVEDFSGAELRQDFAEACQKTSQESGPEITIEADGTSSAFEAGDWDHADVADVQPAIANHVDEELASPTEERRNRLLSALAGSEGPGPKLDEAVTRVSRMQLHAQADEDDCESAADKYKKWAQQAHAGGRATHSTL